MLSYPPRPPPSKLFIKKIKKKIYILPFLWMNALCRVLDVILEEFFVLKCSTLVYVLLALHVAIKEYRK